MKFILVALGLLFFGSWTWSYLTTVEVHGIINGKPVVCAEAYAPLDMDRERIYTCAESLE